MRTLGKAGFNYTLVLVTAATKDGWAAIYRLPKSNTSIVIKDRERERIMRITKVHQPAARLAYDRLHQGAVFRSEEAIKNYIIAIERELGERKSHAKGLHRSR